MRKMIIIVISILLVPVAILIAAGFTLSLGYMITQSMKLIGFIPDNFGWILTGILLVFTIYVSGIPGGIYDYFARMFRKDK